MKPNYREFCKVKEEWDSNNIAYSINDLIVLAKKYNCSIPLKIQLKYKEFNVLERLANLWRYAENYYLETMSGWQKDRLYRFQKSLNLTENETKYLEDICNSIGI